MLLTDAVHDAGNVGLCLRKRNAGLEATNDIEVVVFAVRAELALPIGEGAKDFRNGIDRIDPELDVIAVAETRGKDSNDLHGLIIKVDGFADDGAVAAKVALPETVSEDGDARGAENSFGGEKGAPEYWFNAEERENGRRSNHGRDAFGRASAGKIETQAMNGGELRKGAVLRLEIEEIGAREGRLGEVGLRLPKPHELIRRRKGEGTHEDGINYTEDRGVGTNAKSEGEDGDKREATAAEEHT